MFNFHFIICSLLLTLKAYGMEKHVHEFEVNSGDFIIPGRAIFVEEPDKNPTIFWCHGGPHGYTDRFFLKDLSALTESNVVGFDFRGSIITGYETVAKDPQPNFYGSVDADYGGGHMDDLKAVVDYATEHFSLDKEKYIIAGESFGGYMAALAVTDPSFSHHFKLGILCSGFYDLGFFKEINCPGNGENEEIKRRRSPLNYTHNISQKIILIHGGEQDKTTLVNLEDAKRLFENAKQNNKDIISIFMENEGHDYTDTAWHQIGNVVKSALSDMEK